MPAFLLRRSLLVAAVLCSLLPLAPAQSNSKPPATLPSESPTVFVPTNSGFEYDRREVMVPMRDGVKLHTVVLVPKGAKNAPILLTRTPYNANALTTNMLSSHLGPSLYGYDNATDVIVDGGYIRVIQDVRGKYGSEGDYVMNRPLRGPLNPTTVDHATDTYDTIDWLVKNTPESNGKVGIIGISYDGFTTLMALFHPHPALKVAVPMNPMVDGWKGDDWFHNGAFRQQNMSYIYEQDGTRDNSVKWWTSNFDDYDMFMDAGSAGELGKRRGLEQTGFWRKVIAHPSYDSFWQEQAVDKLLAAEPITVPTLLVHSLWDAEDIYGAMAVYKAIKPKDTSNKVFLVMGPWHHGQGIEDGSTLGAIKFNSDTSLYFRENILAPFLAKYLKDDASAPAIAPVTAYESGSNVWRKLPSWPPDLCKADCAAAGTRLYLHAGSLSFSAPGKDETAFDAYISDPARPVPFRARPIQPIGYDNGLTWPNWLADDQREASGRTDVLVFTSDVLTQPVKISGQPVANLVASTSGTDSDWVVKVIDVYPEEVAGQPKMGGYQWMISADIFRGRYRESLETPKAITSGEPLLYRFSLPPANHVFLPGHRIMVQVQSSWFPLYDRNPQTFVPNIFWAKPQDYRKAEQRIYHGPGQESFIELPIVAKP
ncbi:MAG TPA: CocE/NonD family hydrolase [Edaphobacter sp.]|nr:CocE/NonD family hydrolase [Edaphobacter sp.]